MDDSVLADSTRPDFSLPPLQQADLTIPGLSLPDPTRPDPFLPDLTAPDQPANLDRPDVTQPDPPSADLLAPLIPVLLAQPDARHSALAAYGPVEVQAQVVAEPAHMDEEAASLAANSADARQLPPALDYEQLYAMQDEMSRRARHLAPLLSVLDGHGQVRP
jgi:hypothetical protein